MRGKVAPTKQKNQMRTVRIILRAPDMTDDSSDDEEVSGKENGGNGLRKSVTRLKVDVFGLSSLVSTIFENNNKKIETYSTSNNAMDEELLPDIRLMNPDDGEFTLAEIGEDLDLETELGAAFLDNFGPLDGFGNLDDLIPCGSDEEMPSDLPDLDFDLNNEDLAWINDTLKLDEPFTW
nr:ethylene-responsive transcription factor ERF118-like [Tanacetum cinerariifolium]